VLQIECHSREGLTAGTYQRRFVKEVDEYDWLHVFEGLINGTTCEPQLVKALEYGNPRYKNIASNKSMFRFLTGSRSKNQ